MQSCACGDDSYADNNVLNRSCAFSFSVCFDNVEWEMEAVYGD